MTDFLNDLIARSAGMPETIRPRPTSVFEPAEPGSWPLEPLADAADPQNRAEAVTEEETHDVSPVGRNVPWPGDFAPEVRSIAPQDMQSKPGTPETGRATRDAAPRAAPRPETELPDIPGSPRPRRNIEAKPGAAPSIQPEPQGPELTPAPPMDERPSAPPAEAPARPEVRDRRAASAQAAASPAPPARLRREGTEDRSENRLSARAHTDTGNPSPRTTLEPQPGEDALARMLRKMVIPPRATTLPEPSADTPHGAPDGPTPPLAPALAETVEPSGPAPRRELRPVGPETSRTEGETNPARRHAERAEPSEAPQERRATVQPSAEAAGMWLTPPPEPVPYLPPAPPTETTVHITIGRVEVRADAGQPAPTTPRRPQPKLMNLDDYLSQRSARDG